MLGLDQFDWVVKEDKAGVIALRFAGGHTIRLSETDAVALWNGLDHVAVAKKGTVHLNRRGQTT